MIKKLDKLESKIYFGVYPDNSADKGKSVHIRPSEYCPIDDTETTIPVDFEQDTSMKMIIFESAIKLSKQLYSLLIEKCRQALDDKYIHRININNIKGKFHITVFNSDDVDSPCNCLQFNIECKLQERYDTVGTSKIFVVPLYTIIRSIDSYDLYGQVMNLVISCEDIEINCFDNVSLVVEKDEKVKTNNLDDFNIEISCSSKDNRTLSYMAISDSGNVAKMDVLSFNGDMIKEHFSIACLYNVVNNVLHQLFIQKFGKDTDHFVFSEIKLRNTMSDFSLSNGYDKSVEFHLNTDEEDLSRPALDIINVSEDEFIHCGYIDLFNIIASALDQKARNEAIDDEDVNIDTSISLTLRLK